jgi:ergothioneine biosynthesis protein EgtB
MTPQNPASASAVRSSVAFHPSASSNPRRGSRPAVDAPVPLAEHFTRVRDQTVTLCQPLEDEDYVVQSMPDASPAKWHLAHTSWFFEEFVLQGAVEGYRPYDERFAYLFNSYYNAVGPMHARPNRGLLSRPTVAEVLAYRTHVDEQMRMLLASATPPPATVITLGLHHEQQHQELLLTDIKHLFWSNPLRPVYEAREERTWRDAPPLSFVAHPGGLLEIGHAGSGFCFDNELPRHTCYLQPFQLANRPVTNAEFLEFVRDGGYTQPLLWLSDGWATVQREQWHRPLYWSESLDQEFTLSGQRTLNPHAPVCHVSYYEADAFARWAHARLPSEAEWEVAARAAAPELQGNFLEHGDLHPAAPSAASIGVQSGLPLAQMFGDVWEWTRSPYTPYPGFHPTAGALGEYNGKFMVNQLVLRGGSCATPASHIRPSYRNFFAPSARWQFSGLRLARDAQPKEATC